MVLCPGPLCKVVCQAHCKQLGLGLLAASALAKVCWSPGELGVVLHGSALSLPCTSVCSPSMMRNLPLPRGQHRCAGTRQNACFAQSWRLFKQACKADALIVQQALQCPGLAEQAGSKCACCADLQELVYCCSIAGQGDGA